MTDVRNEAIYKYWRWAKALATADRISALKHKRLPGLLIFTNLLHGRIAKPIALVKHSRLSKFYAIFSSNFLNLTAYRLHKGGNQFS